MSNKAIVIGATGLVGKELVLQLLDEDAYSNVTIFVRRPLGVTSPKLDERVIDFSHLEEVKVDFTNADVFCTIGTTIKKAGSQEAFRMVDYEYPLALAKMAKAGGARQFLIVTAMGANPSSKVFYSRVKGDVEEALKALKLPALHIFRPSLLVGERGEFRLGEKIGEIFLTVLNPIFRGRLRKYGAVHGRMVAKAMLQAALEKKTGIHIYESDVIQKRGIDKN